MEGHSNGRKTERLLRASEYFLRHRNFDSCRKYALKAQESDPHNNGAAQLLALAAVLAAAETRINNNNRADWYAILQVNRYSNDSRLINNQFKDLILLLNPSRNKFDFASEALELVREAWAVLSSPSKKPQFDNELKIFESQRELKNYNHQEEVEEKSGSADETFWTVCPYCYYVYEYPRVYVDCCLRCQNQTCRRGFHAVVLPSPPPPEVAENGRYWCLGFFPLGFEGGERKGFPSWTPFAPFYTGTPKTEAKEKNAVPESGNGCDTDSFIEISDDSDDGLGSENGGTFKNVKTEKAQTEEVKKVGESSSGCVTKRVETKASNRTKRVETEASNRTKRVETEASNGSNRVETEASNGTKPAMKRKKSVAKDTKKLMGRGTRISKQERVPPQSNGELDLNVEASKVDEDFGKDFVGGMEMVSGGDFSMDEVEFFEGDDDIFVGLQSF